MYQRVYVKFLDTVNKREYVRVCSRKPRCKPMNSLRYSRPFVWCCFFVRFPLNPKRTSSALGPLSCPRRSVQMKTLLGLTAAPASASPSQRPRPKQSKPKAEPPPKKRKKWKEEFAASESSAEEGGEEDGERALWPCALALRFPAHRRDPLLTPPASLARFGRPSPRSAFCLPVAQHQDHEGDVQELRGASNQHRFGRGRDDGPREVQR